MSDHRCFQSIFIPLILVELLILACAEDEPTRSKSSVNRPPEIVTLSATPSQIGRNQSTTLLVEAIDDDKDDIHYTWSADVGVFLQGTNRKYAIWQAPDALGSYDCVVAINDGKETTTGRLRIEVIEVALLQISTTELDYSYAKNEQTFTIENLGRVALTWQINATKTWMQASPHQGSLAGGEKCEVMVLVNRNGLAGGAYTGLCGIRSNGGDRDIAAYMDVPMLPEMIRIPAGEFSMGSAMGAPDELPVHPVMVDEFWIDKYEVTNAQFTDFLNTSLKNGRLQVDSKAVRMEGKILIYFLPIYRQGHNVGSPILFSEGQFTVERHEANTPARCVTWYGAQAFARENGKRLPSEAEWEKAAKGMNANLYPWGDAAPTRWFCNYDDRLGYLTGIGSYSPLGDSPYGCADLAGNIWEWCSSLYKPYPYDAKDGREDMSSTEYRVLRGGAWDTPASTLRCALRSFNEPLYKHPAFGFRCAR